MKWTRTKTACCLTLPLLALGGAVPGTVREAGAPVYTPVRSALWAQGLAGERDEQPVRDPEHRYLDIGKLGVQAAETESPKPPPRQDPPFVSDA